MDKVYNGIHYLNKHIITFIICPITKGVEKNNDDARRNYFSSNLQDPCGEVLKAEGRLETTAEYKRNKRQYIKRNEEYWATRTPTLLSQSLPEPQD